MYKNSANIMEHLSILDFPYAATAALLKTDVNFINNVKSNPPRTHPELVPIGLAVSGIQDRNSTSFEHVFCNMESVKTVDKLVKYIYSRVNYHVVCFQ